MPKASVTLPTGENVELMYWETPPIFTRFAALQSLRSKRMSPRSPEALAYFGMEPHYADQFAMLIDADWDATVSPPSSTTSAKAYLKPIAARARATQTGQHRQHANAAANRCQ